MKKYARKCSVTNKGMNEGWYLEGYNCEYIADENNVLDVILLSLIDDPQLAKANGINTVEDLHNTSSNKLLDIAYRHLGIYWTEWEEVDEDYFYNAEGKEFTKTITI